VIPLAAGAGGIALSVVVWLALERAEQRSIDSAFRIDAAGVLRSVEREFATAHELVVALGALFRASDSVNADEFDLFTERLLAGGRHPEIEVIFWVGTDEHGAALTHTKRGTATPNNGPLAPTPAELHAFAAVTNGGQLKAMAPRDSVVLVYGRADSRYQRGVVAARVDVESVTVAAMESFSDKSLHLAVTDVSEGAPIPILLGGPRGALEEQEVIPVAGRRIEVRAIAGPGYSQSKHTAGPLAVLAAMLFATAIGVGYVWIVQTRSVRVALLVKERTATIREVTRLQQAILASANYAIITFDPLGRILTFNPAAESMLGYRAAHVIGGMSPVEFHDPDDLARRARELGVDAGLDVIIQLAGRGDAIGWTYRRADGSTVPVSLSVSALKDDTGEITGYLAIVHDIRAQLAAESELREAKSLAEDASHTKSRFLANMSHELRTPLTAILGYSEMLAEDAAAEGRQEPEQDLRRIHDAGRHLLRLIDDVLDLSKVEAGRTVLQTEPIDIPTLIEDVATTVQPLAASHGNELAVKSQPGTLVSDPTRLKQVLFNLVANAARFTKDGRVALEAECHASEVVFRVRDNGIGMTPEDLSKVFEPFVQADGTSTRRFGGTGLGLAIARQFTELMGGSLTATSTPGEGSEFLVHIPVAPA